jgi:hypothetical protein
MKNAVQTFGTYSWFDEIFVDRAFPIFALAFSSKYLLYFLIPIVSGEYLLKDKPGLAEWLKQ